MIDFTSFLSKGEDRVKLETPVHIGQWTYFSNGRIAVRLPRLPDTTETDDPPKIDKTFATEIDEREFTFAPLEKLETRLRDCRACDNTGKTRDTKPCPECEGEGTINCSHCGHDHECNRCYGEGTVLRSNTSITCPDCERAKHNVRVTQHLWIDGKYFEKIAALPNPMIGTALIGTEPRAIPFRFDGGDGLIMPLRC